MVLWRGGRPLKANSKKNPNTNGREDSALMILDSDDEGQSSNFAKPYVDKPEYEDEEEEFDPKEPYHPITQNVDLILGTAVIHLSTIDMPYQLGTEEFRSLPPLLHEKLIIAVTCADRNIRIVTLPLSPPSMESKTRPELLSDLPISNVGYGSWGEQIIGLRGNPAHYTLPKGVSITLSSPAIVEYEHSSLESKCTQDQSHTPSTAQMDLLITSHSADISGLVLVHKISISTNSSNFNVDSFDQDHLWRAYFLTKPAITAQLHVPISSAQGNHPCLLIAEENGPVRIIDCQSISTSYQESCLLSLYPSYESTPNHVPRFKQLLDAKWILGGEGIATIFADGEWGIWDTHNASILHGGIPTKFTISGWMGSSMAHLSSTKASTSRSAGRSFLAPMTPGTRKVKQEALFTGTHARVSRSTLGGISICSREAISVGKGNDESMVIWHGDHIISIPSLQTYWETAVKRSGHLLGTNSQGQVRERSVPLGGESSRSVTFFPPSSTSGISQPLVESDLLIAGARTLLIIASPIRIGKRIPARRKVSVPVEKADQQLLARGELGVDGMDRILAEMGGGNEVMVREKTNGSHPKRKVMFASSA